MSRVATGLSTRRLPRSAVISVLCGALLTSFCALAQTSDPDVLTQFNLDDSDTPEIATDGSIYGANGIIAGANYVTDTGDGSSGSLEFDGIDDSVSLGGLDVNGTGITLAAWINADSFPGGDRDPRIISKASGIATSTHVFMLSTARKGSSDETVLRARVRVNGEIANFRASGGELETGVWYHVAMTYDESAIRLFVDGVEVGSTSFPEGGGGPVDMDSSVDVAVGANPNGSNYFDGKIDDAIIAQRAFSSAEILALADTDSSGPINTPVANADSYEVTTASQLQVDGAAGVLANDIDADGDPLTAALVDDVSDGTLSLASDGSFTYTSDTGFTGEDSFTYVANDGTEDSAAATVILTVDSEAGGPQNNAPAAEADAYSTDADVQLIVDATEGVLNNDTDAEDDPLTAALVDDVTDGALSLASDGSFTYTPNTGFTGDDSFTYVTNDGTEDSAAATVILTVDGEAGGPQNNAPAAEADAYSTDADVQLIVDAAEGVLNNDTDAEDDPLTAALVDDVTDGALSLASDGSFTYTPNTGFTGDDSFTYVTNDGTEDSAAATVILTVDGEAGGPQNNAPAAEADAYSTDADVQLIVDAAEGVLNNDTDVEDDPLTAALVDDVTDGALSLASDGSFTYTPDTGFTGDDSFTYVTNDGTEDSAAAGVTLTVAADESSETIIDVWYGPNQKFGNVGQPQVWVNVLGNVADDDGIASLTYTLNGGASQQLSFTPDNRRLSNPGDFNIDADRDLFTDGINQIIITAVDTLGNATSRTVNVDHSNGNIWPENYQIDWSQVTSIQDVVEVLDGKWALTDNGIRTVEPGYDRLFAIGDDNWDEYEVVSSFILHSLDLDEFAGVSVIGPWNGHTDDPISGFQPKAGFNPFGAQSWTAFFRPGGERSQVLSSGFLTPADRFFTTFDFEQLYNFRYRVEDEQQNGELVYSLRIWEEGTAEPANWNVQYTDTTSGLTNGSLVFVAHFADTTFGNISVTQIGDQNPSPPTAVDDTFELDQDANLSVGVLDGLLSNDIGGVGPLMAVLDTDVANGMLALASDGAFTYTPDPGFTGTDSFTYLVNDGVESSTAATVTLTVNDDANNSPVAMGDEYFTSPGAQLVVQVDEGVLLNDTDNDNDPLTAVLQSDVSNGILMLESDGSFSYTPDADFAGTDSFDYRASDGTGFSAVVQVSIVVNGTSGNSDLLVRLEMDDDQDPDVALDTSGQGNNGAIDGAEYVAETPDGSSRSLDFDFSSVDLGPLDVDGTGLTLAAWIKADTFPGADRDPRIISKASGVLANRHVFMLSTIRRGSSADTVLRARVRINGETATFRASNGVLETGVWYHVAMTYDESTIRLYVDGEEVASTAFAEGEGGPVDIDSSVDVAVGANPNGSNFFDGKIDDAIIAQRVFSPAELQAIAATGTGGNFVPVASDDSYSVLSDVALVVDAASGVMANDVDGDGDTLTATLQSDVSDGALQFNPDGSFTYTPDSGFTGVDTFTYQLTDGTDTSQIATVSLTVDSEPNEAPLAEDDLYTLSADEPLSVDTAIGVLSNDSDSDGDALTAVLSVPVSNGSLALDSDGSFTYTPEAGFSGTAVFEYLASDGRDNSAAARVVLPVNSASNQVPIASADAYSVEQQSTLTVDAALGVLVNDTDGDAGDSLSVALDVDTSNGVLDLNSDGSFSYTPDNGFIGTDSFVYIATDGIVFSAPTTVDLTVTEEANVAPTAVSDSYSLSESTAFAVSQEDGVLANDFDDDADDVLTALLVNDVDNGSLVFNADGSFIYTPENGFAGVDSFSYQANDGRVNSSVVLVTLDVALTQFVSGSGVYDSDTEVTYKEYWISHEWFTGQGDCSTDNLTGNQFFIEPPNETPCQMFFDIEEDFSNAIGAEVYMDIWRGRDPSSIRFNLNGNITKAPDVGAEWSRTPLVAEISLDELVTGTNVLNLSKSGALYHVHDIAIRIYYSDSQPLLSGGAPIEAPDAFLVSIEDDDNSSSNLDSGGVLEVENDTLTLTAFADGEAKFIEFHAFYDGYDVDNDGASIDWQGRTRNNFHPGGLSERGIGGTIDHIGTVAVGGDGFYSIDWQIPHVRSQSGVRFKVRVVDDSYNVRDAASGITGNFELRRPTRRVDTFSIANFENIGLHNGGTISPTAQRTIQLPSDLSAYTEAYIVGSYWENPFISINGNPDFSAFEDGEDTWTLSIRPVPISQFQNGENVITYSHVAGRFGEFIENPGPMVVLRGPASQVPVRPEADPDNYQAFANSQLNVSAVNGVLSNDFDANDDVLSAQLVGDVTNGTLTLNADGSFSYQPASGYTGDDSFSYIASDGELVTDETTVSITVIQASTDPDLLVQLGLDDFETPSIATDSSTFSNDGTISGAVYSTETIDGSARSLDFDGNSTLDLGPVDANGSGLTLAAWVRADSFPGRNRDRRIISKANGNGLLRTVFMLSTVASEGSDTTFQGRIRIGNTTTQLIATNSTLSTDVWYHTALIYDGSTIKLYLDGVEVASASLSGRINLEPDVDLVVGSLAGGSYAFDGNIDDVRVLQRAYSVSELQSIVNQQPTGNSPPVAVADQYATLTDEPLTIDAASGVLANDTDADGDALVAQLQADVENGALTLNEDGSFSYTPSSGFTGEDSFSYTATDGTAVSQSVEVSILVDESPAANSAPEAFADLYSVTVNTSLDVDIANGVLSNDGDIDINDVLTAVIVDNVTDGVLSLNPDGSFSYQPDTDFVGQDSFTYFATDGDLDSATVSVDITVRSQATDLDLLAHFEFDDFQDSSVASNSGVLDNVGIIQGAQYVTDTADGSSRSLEFDGSNDTVDLGVLDVSEPAITLAAWINADSFPGSARDPRIISKATGTAANDHVFMLGTIGSGANTLLRGRLRINGTTATVIASTGALATGSWYHAAMVYDANTLKLYLDGEEVGSRTLSGPIDQANSVSVAVGSQPGGSKVFDGKIDDVRILQRALSVSEIQEIAGGTTVSPNPNGIPVAENDAYAVDINSVLTVAADSGVLANDTDPDVDDSLIAVLEADVSNGTLSLSIDGSFDYQPDADFSGTDSFSYRAFDGVDSSDLAQVTLQVAALDNQAPVAVADQYATLTDEPLTIDAASGVLANDTDADGDALVAQLQADVENGALTLNEDGSFSYTPSSGFTGEDSFSYTATDGTAVSQSVEVSILVDESPAANSAPEAFADLYSVTVNTSLDVDIANGVLSNDGDIDINDVLTAVIVDNVTDGVLSLNPDGSFSYQPDTDFVGQDSFTYFATDGDLDSATVSVDITVRSQATDLDLLAHFEFDDFQDSSVASNSGVLDNVGIIQGAQYVTDTADGSSRSLEFDGSNDTVDLGVLDVSEPAITLAAWINADSFPGSARDPRIISKATGTAANDHVFMLGTIGSGANTLLRGRLRINGTTATVIASTGALATGSWYHAAMVYDANTLKLFLDGEEVGSRTLSGPIDQANTVSVAVGSQPGGSKVFDGKIDDVRILQRALSVSEIQNIAQGTTVPPTPNGTPIAENDAYAVDINSVLTVAADSGVLANDTDPDVDDSLIAVLEDDVSNGTLSLSIDGSFDYQPDADFSGTDSFSYRAFDGVDSSDIAQVTLQVAALDNQAPVALADSYDAVAGTQLQVTAVNGVLANDTDANAGDTLTASLVTDTSNGSLLLNDDGSFTYTSTTGFVGTDSFSYLASDGSEDSAEVVASIEVTAPASDGPDLLVQLEFEDSSTASVAQDSSTYGNSGVINGATYSTDTVDGSDNSMLFSGSDSIDLGAVDVQGSGLTLTGWFKANSFPGSARDPRLVSKASGTGANDHIFMLSTIRSGSNTFLRGRVRINGTTNTLIANTGNISTDVWYHAAFVYDESTVKLYLDGIEVGSSPLIGSVDVDSTVSVSVGAQPGGGKTFDGALDDIRILQGALSSQEINAIVDATPDTPDTPDAPENVSAEVTASTEVNLSWSASQGAVVYDVFRDGELIDTVTDTNYLDETVESGITYTYDIVAVSSSGGESQPTTVTVTTSETAPSDWWDESWNYRLRVTVNSLNTDREDRIAVVPVNLDDFIDAGEGALDESRVRCVEIDNANVVINETTRCQSGDGELIVLVDGDMPAGTTRYFHAYFDVENAGQEDTRASLVTLTPGVLDEGFDALEITTNTGTIFYHTQGGGVSSLIDSDGNDWVSYNTQSGGLGEFRGIPNLVPPSAGGFFHPGFTTSSTTVLDEGPLRIRFESVTNNQEWKGLWDVYPDHVAFTVLEKADDNYWFLYEGTPGGAFDAGDSTVRSIGTDSMSSASVSWRADIPDEEWVIVGASEASRTLFFSKRNDDAAIDSYRPLNSNGQMTVLGFGRNIAEAELTETDETFFFGFLENGGDFDLASETIRSIARDISVDFSGPETRP